MFHREDRYAPIQKLEGGMYISAPKCIQRFRASLCTIDENE